MTGELRNPYRWDYLLLCTSRSSHCLLMWAGSLFRAQRKVPTLWAVITFGNVNHTDLPNDTQQMTCPCGQNTALGQSFMSNADPYRLLLLALLGLSDHVMLLLSGSLFKFTNWVMFTAAWWTHPHRFVWRYVHHHNRWHWTASFFFLDQGPEEAACWRLHQDSKRANTSLSPHYASILSLRFRLVFALFMLVRGGTLWAFKSGGSDCISI